MLATATRQLVRRAAFTVRLLLLLSFGFPPPSLLPHPHPPIQPTPTHPTLHRPPPRPSCG